MRWNQVCFLILAWPIENSSIRAAGIGGCGARCPPMGDTYTADFRAITAGQALLDAKGATTCEAMAKSSCPDQHFTITVVVGR